MSIVEAPRHGVENAGYAILRHAATEQRVALEGAESVVLDFGVRGGRALTYEVEVYIGAERRRVEKDEPDVDAQFGLCGR